MKPYACLSAACVALLGLSAPAMADFHGSPLVACQNYANSLTYTGGNKVGYADQYQAVIDACLNRHRSYIDPHANRRTARYPITGPAVCPPGAPTMYRGTLYCFN